MIKKKISKKPKGQVFLLSIMLLAAVSVMGVILITVFTQDLKLAYESSESTKALYAADSDMERLLYWELVEEGDPNKKHLFTMNNGTSFTGDASNFNSFSNPGFLATVGYNKSTSTKSTVARGMKINFQPSI